MIKCWKNTLDSDSRAACMASSAFWKFFLNKKRFVKLLPIGLSICRSQWKLTLDASKSCLEEGKIYSFAV